MSKKQNNVTINDVALAAGVSKGTVDRVLHDRGEVSRKSRDKVLRAIEELGFSPNIYASLLASPKDRLIQCLIPEFSEGEFWSLADKGIREAAKIVSRYGVRVETVTYDQYDAESFRKACSRILECAPSGVIVAPMFGSVTLSFVKELSEAGIPYIYVDSKLEEDGYLAYFGMQMYRSGYLCAHILTDGRSVPDTVHVVRIARDKAGLSDPTAMRRAGFMDYMSCNFPDVRIENVFIDPNDSCSIDSRLDAAFGSSSGPKFIVMFNSRVHLVADYIGRRGVRDFRVVGFDVLEKNLAALRDGRVQVLIAQHMDKQLVAAVSSLTDYLLLGDKVMKRDNYAQMDILNICNCDYY